jgi:hypothetical protein
MRVLLLGLLSCGLLMVAGCPGTGGDLPDVVPVSGTVTLDGEPVSGVMVTFSPGDTTRGGICTGITDESGRYELKDGQQHVGAPPGQYAVTCSKFVMPDGSLFTSDGSISPMEAGAKELFPQYSQEGGSELTATVPAGGGTIDFDLKSEGESEE